MPGILPLTRIAFIQAGADWRLTGTAALALEQMYLADSRNTRQRTRPAAKSTHNAANAAAQR